jgi:hypothetical protein
MTGHSSAAPSETFNESLLECVEDINKLLPRLGRRYDMTVIMSALAEHVGSALKVLLLKKVCDAQQVHQVLKNIETSAFLTQSAQAPSENKAESKAERKSEEAAEGTPAAADSKPRDSDP